MQTGRYQVYVFSMNPSAVDLFVDGQFRKILAPGDAATTLNLEEGAHKIEVDYWSAEIDVPGQEIVRIPAR